jgi:HK97 family phage major capsid protein
MPPEPSALATLGWVARARAIAKKSFHHEAEQWLIDNRAPEQAQRIFKAAIGAGSTTDSALPGYGISIGAWSDSVRTRSAFYRILADGAFTRLPMHRRIGLMSSAVSGSVVAEGHAAPVSKIKIDNVLLLPTRVTALVVCTDTLLLEVGAAGQSLFNRELAGAISDAVDSAFLGLVTSTGTTSIASTAPLADVRAALLAVETGANSRLYWIASPDVAKKASTLSWTTGGSAFAAASASGGELCNLPLLVASGLAAGELLLVDAAGIAVDGEAPTVDVSSETDILMDTAPAMTSSTPTPGTMVSMFATNSTALLATAMIGAVPIRDSAVALVHNIAWGT